MTKPILTQLELKKALEYHPETGLFIRIECRSNRVQAGEVAGYICSISGYVVIGVSGTQYLAHRLAHLYMTGEWPDNQIDHDDHVRHNNKWDNLFEATNQENHKNRTLNKNNTSGVVGVGWDKERGKWWAAIKTDYKRINLGRFTDKFEAICIRMSANNKYNFHSNHGK